MEPGRPGPARRQPVKIPVVPYARPKPKVEPNRGIFSRIRSFLFGGKSQEPAEQKNDVVDVDDSRVTDSEKPSESVEKNEEQPVSASAEHSSWVADPNDTLRDFFEKKGDERLSQMEVVGVLSLIGQAVSQNRSLVDFSSMHLDSTNASSLDVTPDVTASTPLPRRDETPQNSIFRSSTVSFGDSYSDLSTRSLKRPTNGSSPWASRRRGLASGPRLQKNMHPYRRNPITESSTTTTARNAGNVSKSQSASALMSVINGDGQKHQKHVPSRPSKLRESISSANSPSTDSQKPSELFKPATKSLFDTKSSFTGMPKDNFPQPTDASTPAKQSTIFSSTPAMTGKANDEMGVKYPSFDVSSAKQPTSSILTKPLKDKPTTTATTSSAASALRGSLEAGSKSNFGSLPSTENKNVTPQPAFQFKATKAPSAESTDADTEMHESKSSGDKERKEEELLMNDFAFELPAKEATPSHLSHEEQNFVESAKSSFTF